VRPIHGYGGGASIYWDSILSTKVHTSTCHLAMVGARLAAEDVDGECENKIGQIYVPAAVMPQYVCP
jgi:hypothetical protein